eukprot:359567-Chlamydomonas_euryale.AAC.3
MGPTRQDPGTAVIVRAASCRRWGAFFGQKAPKRDLHIPGPSIRCPLSRPAVACHGRRRPAQQALRRKRLQRHVQDVALLATLTPRRPPRQTTPRPAGAAASTAPTARTRLRAARRRRALPFAPRQARGPRTRRGIRAAPAQCARRPGGGSTHASHFHTQGSWREAAQRLQGVDWQHSSLGGGWGAFCGLWRLSTKSLLAVMAGAGGSLDGC